MNTEPKRLTIGVYDIPSEEYHADCVIEPSLSNSLAKNFIDGCPLKAYLAHPRLNKNLTPDHSTESMDFGTLGHRLLLGKGAEIDICQADDWRTKDARAFRDAARAAGRTPVLQKHYDKAVLLHDGARREFARLGILEPFDKALKERTYIWRDSDCYLRSMIDAVHIIPDESLGYVFDLKITADAANDTCARQIGSMHYDMQAHFQMQGVLAENKRIGLAIEGRLKHFFLFVENEFPFLVNAVELSEGFRDMGRKKFEYVRGQWKKCTHEGRWPGYSPGITTAEPKPWDMMRAEQLALET